MKLPRRTFLYLAAGAAALPVLSSIAWAQAYPTRPVRFIHGFAAGGSGDIAARLIAQLLSDRLGQQFIVENRTGAGGNIAVEAVARAPADGVVLGVSAAMPLAEPGSASPQQQRAPTEDRSPAPTEAGRNPLR